MRFRIHQHPRRPHRFIGLALLGAASLAAALPAHAAHVRLLTATVARIVDGDTLIAYTARARFRVRLLGINAPEIAHDGQRGERYGLEAKGHLEHLVAGRSVRLEAYGRDRYERVLAVIWADRVNINLEMVRAGLARAQGGAGRRAYAHAIKDAEAQARRAGIGIWASGRRSGTQRSTAVNVAQGEVSAARIVTALRWSG